MAERLDTERLDQATLPVLPLASGVVLPQMVVTLALETDEARAAADAAADAEGELLLVPRFPDGGRYGRVGTIAKIENKGTLPGGTPALVVRAIARADSKLIASGFSQNTGSPRSAAAATRRGCSAVHVQT